MEAKKVKFILFGHSQCESCKREKIWFETNKIPYLYVDVTNPANAHLISEYLVTSVPTTIIIKDGKPSSYVGWSPNLMKMILEANKEK